MASCAPSSDVSIDETPSDNDSVGSAVIEYTGVDANCVVSDNLLADTQFTDVSQGVWNYTQHSGDRSFSVTSEQGELKITRTGGEPWMLLKQQIAMPEINRDLIGKWVFSAELKGQVEIEAALLGFEQTAGLVLQPASSAASASLAEHDPNQGVWDWQRVEVMTPVLLGSKVVQAGFVHQAGGSLWARNPSLVLMECSESG
jgi:hypothetical protein